MNFVDFIERYKESVKANTGRHLSIKKIANLLLPNNSQFESRLEAWSKGNGSPKGENDRNLIKSFFGIENLAEISEKELQEAINRYPKPFIGVVENEQDDVNDELQMQRGQRLSSIREALGCKTLDDFGVMLKGEGKPVDKATLSKMENGKMRISKPILLELVSTFNVNKDYLLYGVGEMFNAEYIQGKGVVNIQSHNVQPEQPLPPNLKPRESKMHERPIDFGDITTNEMREILFLSSMAAVMLMNDINDEKMDQLRTRRIVHGIKDVNEYLKVKGLL